MHTRSTKTAGTLIFLVGLFAGLALAAAAMWGDFEAMSYFYTGAGYDAFTGLKCPAFMSRAEKAVVSARLENSTEGEIKPYYQVEISGLVAPRTLEDQVAVPAHSSQTASWTVDANDIDLEQFVMVRVRILPVAGFSTREGTCGILALDLLGLSGSAMLDIALAISLLGIPIGLGLREHGDPAAIGRTRSARNSMRAAGVSTLVALLGGLTGWWLLGVVGCAVTLLLLVIMLRYATS